MTDIEQEVAGLDALSSTELRERWARLTATAVPRISPKLALLLIVIAPFLLFGGDVEALADRALTTNNQTVVVVLVIVLLAADILLPIPSSVVATTSGVLLGPWLGTLASATGLAAGAAAMLVVMRSAGAPLARHLLGEDDYHRLVRLAARNGPWLLAMLRPVPVLSEASVIALGAARVPAGPALAAIALSSLLVAAMYASLGALARSSSSEVLLVAGSCLPPLLAWMAARRRFRTPDGALS